MASPRIIYGTAWKKDRTADLVVQAIQSGFRAIDTACQPKHYQEALVGQAVALCLRQGILSSREELFLQTKFTPISGQDMQKPLPYDFRASLATQVNQSFATSQHNLGTPYVDSLVLHSPLRSHRDNMEVWRAFEDIHSQGKARALGISNCYDLRSFAALWEEATIKPSYLQNRFYKDSNYDTALRQYCRERGVVYQSFWTLTANPHVIRGPCRDIAARHRKTPEQVFFAFVISQGIVPLTGTTSGEHMLQDLASLDLTLSKEEILAIHGCL